MIRDRIFAFAIVVILVLLVAIVYPGALAHPYSETPTTYEIAHESSEAFEETVSREDVEPSEPTPASDLSPSTRQALEEAKTQPRRTNDARGDGWQYLGSVRVCDAKLLACDEYEDAPDFPRTVEDDDGEVYITRTDGGVRFDADPLFEWGLKGLSIVPYTAFLGFAASERTIRRKETLAFAGHGLALAAAAFAYPYLVMFELIPWPLSTHLAALGITWAVMLTGVGTHLWRERSTDGPRSATT